MSRYVPEHQDVVLLQEQLNRLRWSLRHSHTPGKRAIYDSFGQHVGDFTVEEAWDYLERLSHDWGR